MTSPHATLDLPKALGDNLLLRLATEDDIDAVADLNERGLLEEHESSGIFSTWTRDLLSGRHPTATVTDCILVEDTASGQIVSATTLIPQIWRYEDIPFGVGRPEMVSTDKAYRRRGLVRAIFGAFHDLSAAYGHQVQAITGIRWFYRQFDYEYALLRSRGRALPIDEIVPLKEDETEPYRIRPATEADIPTIVRLYEHQCARKLVTTIIDEVRWQYDLFGQTPGSAQNLRAYTITDQEDRPIGYYTTPPEMFGSSLYVWELGLEENISLYRLLPTVLRALKQQGDALVEKNEAQNESFKFIQLALSPHHPAYEALDAKLQPPKPPYAFYVRLADVPAFIRHIAPVLERRLADSVMRGFSGSLNLSFFRSGLQLTFEEGRLTQATDWSVPDDHKDWEGAHFPPLVFLKLLFGYRSLDELRYAYPDCAADEEATLLLNILFPKQDSWVLPLG